MSERELHRAVAHRLGESVESIQRLGFQVLGNAELVEGGGPLVVDWETGQPACLGQVLSDDDWPGRVDPVHSYDEDCQFDEDDLCVAA